MHDVKKLLTEEPCPICLPLAVRGVIRAEMVQRLPVKGFAPLSKRTRTSCCFDCAKAEGLMSSYPGLDFTMLRIAVGNERQDNLRLPGYPSPLGIIPNVKGDFDDHLKWLDRHSWFGTKEVES